MHFVIIGNGAAGIAAAEAIRRHDQDSPITILGQEPYHSYSRIRLIDYLAGKVDEAGLLLKQPDWYTRLGIEVRLGQSALRFDAQRRQVHCDSGAVLSYDRLLIAAGSTPFVPPLPGRDSDTVLTLRTLDDAKRILATVRAKPQARVIMLGGGILSLEAASALRQGGCEITVVEFFDRLLPRQMDAAGSRILQGLFEARGMRFMLGARSEEIVTDSQGTTLRLADGGLLTGELILVGAGVRPAVAVAQASGLDADKGIPVNDRMETTVAGVYAAGDVANHRGIAYGIWPAAMTQGQVAGSNMAGGEQTFTGMAMSNTLKVAGIDLFAVGNIDNEGQCRAVTQSTPQAGIYKKLVLQEGKVVGAILLGDLKARPTIQRAMAEGRVLSQAEQQGLLD